MKNLNDFQKAYPNVSIDSSKVVGGADEYTESGQDTVNCDYYATLDGEHTDCWRLDQNCCDEPSTTS